jgi:hypothetical protein
MELDSHEPELDCLRPHYVMELDSKLQIFFGISATLIAVLAVWFAWYTTRGKYLHARFMLSIAYQHQIINQGDMLHRKVRATTYFPFSIIAGRPQTNTFGLDEGCLWKTHLDPSL